MATGTVERRPVPGPRVEARESIDVSNAVWIESSDVSTCTVAPTSRMGGAWARSSVEWVPPREIEMSIWRQ